MDWLSALFSGAFGLLSSPFSLLQNLGNLQSNIATNLTNLRIARETNQANVEQANLAYQRSLPINQVNNLVAAGMSKSAALNSLSGGGTYTAPVMQPASVQAPHFDFSQIASTIERLGNIPANVAQAQLQQEQLRGLKIDNDNKIAAEKRADDLHQYQVWKEQYGKESATKLDAAKNLIMSALLDSDKDINDFVSFKQLINDLGLKDADELQGLPSLAWSQLENDIRNSFADARAERDQKNKDTAANDAHDLAEFNKSLAKLDISDKQQTLVYKLGILANQLALSNLQLDDANKDAIIRNAGFENEKEAYEALQAAENLRARESKRRAVNQANYDDNYKGFMEFLDYSIDKVNPLKNLLSK